MGNFKNTQGKWRLGLENKFAVVCDTIDGLKKTICYTDTPHKTFEAEANAKLIAEAGNVTNETGKTPRQLADENKELLNALKPFAELYKQFDGIVGNRPSEGIICAWHHNKHGESQLTVEMLKDAYNLVNKNI